MRFGLYALTNPRAKIQDLESPIRLLRGVSRLGLAGASPVPPELLPMGARVLAQGYINRVSMPLVSDWLLPNWMHAQSDPASPTFVPRSVSNLMVNQTERSWTALGLPGRRHQVESMVDGWGLLTPVPGGPSLDWWVAVDGSSSSMMAPGKQDVKQRLQGGLPVVVTAYEAGGLRASSEAWMLSLEDGDWAVMQVVLFNIADMPLRGTFHFALRPYNPEGISPIYRIEYKGHTLLADGRPGPFTWPAPDGWRLSSLRHGDLFRCPEGGTGERSLHDPRGLAHGLLEYRFNIEPWEEAEFLAFMPVAGSRESGVHTDSRLPTPDFYSRTKAATTLRWRDLLDSGMRVSLPDRELQESWEANRCHLFALHDGDTITPGPDLYHSFWFRDAAFMLYAFSTHGYTDAARQLLRGFARRQRRGGAFISQGSEWDGTGQALWAMGQHLALHPDSALHAELAPQVERGARWIVHMLERHGGLMPPGLSSEHFGPPNRYYWDDLWSLAGLLSARQMLGEGYEWIDQAERRLRRTLMAHFKREAARCGGALPAAPGRPVDLGATGTLAAWYPLALLPPTDSYVGASLDAIRDRLFYDGALYVDTGHSGWGSYINMRIAGCYLLAGRIEEGWELLRWLLRHASPTYNWPEAIHTRSGRGSTGDGHHGWASAEWLLLVRSLLLREEGTVMHIAPALPESWLRRAGSVSVESAPTRFGPISYQLEWDDGAETVSLTQTSDWRTPPAEVVLRVPGVTAAVVDGIRVKPQGERVYIPVEARETRITRQPSPVAKR
jgi:hypothetical protein